MAGKMIFMLLISQRLSVQTMLLLPLIHHWVNYQVMCNSKSEVLDSERMASKLSLLQEPPELMHQLNFHAKLQESAKMRA